MSEEVAVQTAAAPAAATVSTEEKPVEPAAEAAAKTEHAEVIATVVDAVIAAKDLEWKQFDQLQQAIEKQEADVKKKLAEVAKAAEKKIRPTKVEECKNALLGIIGHFPNMLKLKQIKDHYGSSFTDDEYEQALNELVENGSICLEQGWYVRKRDNRGG